MSFFDLFSFSSSKNNSVDKGREVMSYFHESMKQYPSYKLDFEQLLELVSGSPKAVQFFLDGLGIAAIEIENDGFLNRSKIKFAMENLAATGLGKIPSRNSFFSALSNEAQNYTFLDALPSVVKGTAGEIASGAQAIGDSLISTGKILTFIFPAVVVVAILFITKEKVKKAAK